MQKTESTKFLPDTEFFKTKLFIGIGPNPVSSEISNSKLYVRFENNATLYRTEKKNTADPKIGQK